MYYADNEHVQRAAMGLLGVLHYSRIFWIFCVSLTTLCANFHSGWTGFSIPLMAFSSSRDVYDLKVCMVVICLFLWEGASSESVVVALWPLYARSGTWTVYRLHSGLHRIVRVLQMVCMSPFRTTLFTLTFICNT